MSYRALWRSRHALPQSMGLSVLLIGFGWVTGCATQPVAQQTPVVEALPTLPSAAIATPTPTPAATPLVVSAADGHSQITLPPGWTAETSLNSEAQLQAANRTQGVYLIVLSEGKDKLKDVNRDKHSELTRGLLTQNLVQPKVVGPTTIKTVKDYSATQYEIQGSLNDINVQFLHTTLETPTRFVQILAWTTPDAYQRNKQDLQAIIQSFVEK